MVGVVIVIVLGIAVLGAFSFDIVVFLLYTGTLFAPFATFLCAWAARRRGMNTRYYAIAGAVCSILIFLPWIYLIVRMHGRTPPNTLVRAGYVFLYFTWIFFSVGIAVTFLITGDSDMTKEELSSGRAIWGIFVMVSALLWLTSLIRLLLEGGYEWNSLWGKSSNAKSEEDLIPVAYVQPFALALANLVLLVAILAYTKFQLYEGLLPILPI